MDISILSQRLDRIYNSFDSLETNDLSNVKVETTVSDTQIYSQVDFNGSKTDVELQNSIFALVANIASIKDYLKKWCVDNEIVFDIENIINSNTSTVAVIHDLWNIDKHANLNRASRSGFLPKIVDLKQVLQISSGTEAGSFAIFTHNPLTGEMETQTGGSGSTKLVISGKIVDENNNIIGDLLDVCDKALTVWEGEIEKIGISIT